MNKIQFKALYIATITLGFFACKEKDKSIVPTAGPKYVMGVRTQTGAGQTDYLLAQDAIDGDISIKGKGKELLGFQFYHKINNHLVTLGYENKDALVFQVDATGALKQTGKFAFSNAITVFGNSDDEGTMLGVEIPGAGFNKLRYYFVNVASGKATVTKIVEDSLFFDRKDSLIPWPTALLIRKDKLFVPFHPLHASGSYETPAVDSAYVGVYSYPDMKLQNIITDERVGPIGVNGTSAGLIETESGDIYSYSGGSVGAGFTKVTRPSGILKIAANATEFDKSYFFNVQEATGKKLYNWDYLGSNKALAYIENNTVRGPWDTFMKKDALDLYIIDLVAQTATQVQGVPTHGKRYTPLGLLVENGKTYVSVETEVDAFVYEIDINNATGAKKGKIEAAGVVGFSKLNPVQ